MQEAARFLESFLQKYKKIKDFVQTTIARCHQTGEPDTAKAFADPSSLPADLQPPLISWPCSIGGGGQMGGDGVSTKWDSRLQCEKGPKPGSA